jgi:hypothetical protein
MFGRLRERVLSPEAAEVSGGRQPDVRDVQAQRVREPYAVVQLLA